MVYVSWLLGYLIDVKKNIRFLEAWINNLHSTLGSFTSVEEETVMIVQNFYVQLFCFLFVQNRHRPVCDHSNENIWGFVLFHCGSAFGMVCFLQLP